jgi:hypothetical protein
MTFTDREKGEPLAMYLHRNATALNADRRQAAILRDAAAMSHPLRSARDRATAGRMAEQVRKELQASVAEVVFAAQARGESVEAFNDAGAVRIKGRDGLVSLLSSKGLTEQLYNSGMQYRGLYERVGYADIGSQMGAITGLPGAARTSVDGLHIGKLTKAYAGYQLSEAERAAPSDSLEILRAVAGQGQSLTCRGMSGHVRKRRLELLCAALKAVRLSLATTGGLRITGT